MKQASKQASKQEQNIDEVIEAVKKYTQETPRGFFQQHLVPPLLRIPLEPLREDSLIGQVDINNKESLEIFLYGRRSGDDFKPKLSFDEMQKVLLFFTDESVSEIMSIKNKKSDDLGRLWQSLKESEKKIQRRTRIGIGVGALLLTGLALPLIFSPIPIVASVIITFFGAFPWGGDSGRDNISRYATINTRWKTRFYGKHYETIYLILYFIPRRCKGSL